MDIAVKCHMAIGTDLRTTYPHVRYAKVEMQTYESSETGLKPLLVYLV